MRAIGLSVIATNGYDVLSVALVCVTFLVIVLVAAALLWKWRP